MKDKFTDEERRVLANVAAQVLASQTERDRIQDDLDVADDVLDGLLVKLGIEQIERDPGMSWVFRRTVFTKHPSTVAVTVRAPAGTPEADVRQAAIRFAEAGVKPNGWIYREFTIADGWDEETERRITEPVSIPMESKLLETQKGEFGFCPACSSPQEVDGCGEVECDACHFEYEVIDG